MTTDVPRPMKKEFEPEDGLWRSVSGWKATLSATERARAVPKASQSCLATKNLPPLIKQNHNHCKPIGTEKHSLVEEHDPTP